MRIRRALAPAALTIAAASLLAGQALRRPVDGPHSRIPAPKRLDAWRVVGPGGGGAQYTPTVNPGDGNMVFVSCDMGGNYISRDGGRTWRMMNLRGQAGFFSFDPGNPRVVYIGADRGLWRTEDAGDTWSLLYPDPKAMRRIAYNSDEASALLYTNVGIPDAVTAMEVDPADSNVLYAVIGLNFMQSTDRGASWKNLAKMAEGAARKILIDPYSPASRRTVYVVTWYQVYAYENGEWRANDKPNGPKTWIYEAAGGYRPGQKPLIYIRTDHSFAGTEPRVLGGLLVSADGGETWQQAHRSVIEKLANKWFLPDIRGIAVAPSQPEKVYFSYSGLQAADDPETYFGVASTTNGGDHWEYTWKNTSITPPSFHDAWLNETFGPYWGENPLAMGADPSDPNRLFASDYGRTLRSADGGISWEGVYSHRLPDGTFSTTGLDVTTSYGVHFDPSAPNRMFISYTDIGPFRSENGGKSWVFSGSGIPSEWRNTTYWMTFDPHTPGRVWATVSGIHDLPRSRMLTRGTDAFKGGVVVSNDGGKTWTPANNGMAQAACTHILLDSASPRSSRTLYVAAMGKGVYKSTDGGTTWSLKTLGLPATEPLAWRLALDSRGTLYLVVARRADNNAKYGTSDDGGLYQSTDGGETWSPVSLPQGLNGPTGIAVDPGDRSRLLLSAWSRDDIFLNSFQGGVFLSSDQGRSWKNVLSTDQHVYDVTIDPAAPNVVYAAGFQASIWRSVDGGANWKRIPGFNFKNAHRVIPDLLDPTMIYVTTFGGSVWHGPAAGDSSAKEDIVTPVAGYAGIQ